MKIVDYQIAETESKSDTEKEVLILISDGWQPLGGVSVEGRCYSQAMVKFEVIDAIQWEKQ